MTAKEYLCQAYWLDRRIDSKLEQLSALRDTTTKANAVMSDVVVTRSRNMQSLQDTIVKIVDMENELDKDIDMLVDLKRDMMSLIKEVKNPEYQTLLELRYLCFKSWDYIAEVMGYSINNVFKIHAKALRNIRLPETLQ